jgi:hypothetical protein
VYTALIGVEFEKYIRFYNLQTYDRIVESGIMNKTEQAIGAEYQTESVDYDDIVDLSGSKEQRKLVILTEMK